MEEFSAILEKEDDWYVAHCPELGVASQGKTVELAISNLKEAVELYLEDEDVQKMLKGRKFSRPIVTTIAVSSNFKKNGN
ncbi:type II toxin-antitoxin system HicB family antitoxin [Candidatus Micrarchaeota archaeon]|nr:type II toxin-antitoxin system HicB family antitoxin [Candidatus Micrarchaeota archaeon]